MVRARTLTIAATTWLLGATPAAQTRPYDVLMKDVASTADGLRKGLGSGLRASVGA